MVNKSYLVKDSPIQVNSFWRNRQRVREMVSLPPRSRGRVNSLLSCQQHIVEFPFGGGVGDRPADHNWAHSWNASFFYDVLMLARIRLEATHKYFSGIEQISLFLRCLLPKLCYTFFTQVNDTSTVLCKSPKRFSLISASITGLRIRSYQSLFPFKNGVIWIMYGQKVSRNLAFENIYSAKITFDRFLHDFT